MAANCSPRAQELLLPVLRCYRRPVAVRAPRGPDTGTYAARWRGVPARDRGSRPRVYCRAGRCGHTRGKCTVRRAIEIGLPGVASSISECGRGIGEVGSRFLLVRNRRPRQARGTRHVFDYMYSEVWLRSFTGLEQSQRLLAGDLAVVEHSSGQASDLYVLRSRHVCVCGSRRKLP